MQQQQQQQQSRKRQSVAYAPATQLINRRIPEELSEFIPAAEQYQKLYAMEQKLDATIARKRFDMQDAMGRPTKIRRTLRIWCSNTAADQAWQDPMITSGLDENTFDFESGNIPSWTLRVEGKILVEEGDDPATLPKFTDLFRSIIIEEDKTQDANSMVTMDSGPVLEFFKTPPPSQQQQQQQQQQQKGTAAPPPPPPHSSVHGIEVKRKGDTDTSLNIMLTLDHVPEQYTPVPALAHLLDLREATRHQIIAALWSYIRTGKLQDPEDKRLVHCDAALRTAFGSDRLFFPDVPKQINKMLLPLAPIVIPYQVRTDVEHHTGPHYFDITIDIDDPFKSTTIAPLLASLAAPNKEIEAIDAKLAATVAAMDQSLAKRDFFLAFSETPTEVLNRWLESQHTDMEVMMGGVARVSGEDARRAWFYAGDKAWLRESLAHYLSQPKS